MRNLAPAERLRQHANHFSASSQRRICYRAHQPAAGPAINQSEAGFGDRSAERCRLSAKSQGSVPNADPQKTATRT